MRTIKNGQSQSANLAMINSFILMKGGLLTANVVQGGGRQALFGYYRKIRLQLSFWLLTPSPTPTLLPHIHWVENAKSIIIAWVLPLPTGPIAITSLVLSWTPRKIHSLVPRLLCSQPIPLTTENASLGAALQSQREHRQMKESLKSWVKSVINQFKGLQGSSLWDS